VAIAIAATVRLEAPASVKAVAVTCTLGTLVESLATLG